MDLVVAGTFGSLPEASIAFSSLASAGFTPVAGYNMNTPGAADGMAPSAYRVLVPELEAQAASDFLAELHRSLADGDHAAATGDDGAEEPGQTTLGRIRSLVRYLAGAVVLGWIAMAGLALLHR
ncbi:MAG TPA: hypothetical protein VGM25_01440 [Caulobacteraceae bacterium]|jgi:hypothetical protein